MLLKLIFKKSYGHNVLQFLKIEDTYVYNKIREINTANVFLN